MSHIPGLSFSMETRATGPRIWLGDPELCSCPFFCQGPGLECGCPVLQPLVPVPLLCGHEAGEKHREGRGGGVLGASGQPAELSPPTLVLRALRSQNRFCT